MTKLVGCLAGNVMFRFSSSDIQVHLAYFQVGGMRLEKPHDDNKEKSERPSQDPAKLQLPISHTVEKGT